VKAQAKPDVLATLSGSFLRLAAASAAARAIKGAATEASTRLLLTMGAGLAAAVGLLCFSTAALTLLERTLDPAPAWAILGGFYSIAGIVLYFAATRRRR
jgi:hypothetical protein